MPNNPNHDHVATYLSDHLAGAASAIALMQHLESTFAGSDVATLIAGVRTDVEADRQELERLMAALGVKESTPRKVVGWLGAKMGELKLQLDDHANGPLYLLEALDGLAMGIDGKLALWSGLAAAARSSTELRLLDYELLSQRAREQRQRIEPARANAARGLFGGV